MYQLRKCLLNIFVIVTKIISNTIKKFCLKIIQFVVIYKRSSWAHFQTSLHGKKCQSSSSYGTGCCIQITRRKPGTLCRESPDEDWFDDGTYGSLSDQHFNPDSSQMQCISTLKFMYIHVLSRIIKGFYFIIFKLYKNEVIKISYNHWTFTVRDDEIVYSLWL